MTVRKTVAAARLTGCQKYRGRQKNGRLLRWSARLGHLPYCLQSHPGRTPGSGVRAHSFNPGIAANRFPAVLCSRMEEPFEQLFLFRFQGQSPDSPPLWWRLPKEQAPDIFSRRSGSFAGAGAAADIKCNETMRPRQGSRQAAFSSFSPSSGGASL